MFVYFFFFQAEDGIRDIGVTGVQTCALPISAGAVAFVGTIGFIGLVAPHFARYFAGEDQRYLAPMASLFGILLIAFASILAKLVIPGIIIPIDRKSVV